MNRKDLYQSFNNIDDDILERSEKNVKKNGFSWVKWGAVAACLCLMAGIGFMNMDAISSRQRYAVFTIHR